MRESLPAGLDIGDRIVVLIVEHIAGVVADLHALIAHLRDDAGAVGSGSRIATVLLDNDRHTRAAGNRPKFLQIADPDLVLPWLDGAERRTKGIPAAAACSIRLVCTRTDSGAAT